MLSFVLPKRCICLLDLFLSDTWGYLLHPKKISATDFEALVEKMTARITIWYAKKLSYTARIQLVDSVMISITSFWCQLFILPKAIIKEVKNICRAYLWHADYQNTSLSNVNWSHIYKPKKDRGLGVRNLEL